MIRRMMLPKTLHNLTAENVSEIAARTCEPFSDVVQRMKIDNDLVQDLTDIYIPLAAGLIDKKEGHDGPLVIGINGAQGAGKSTFCRLLQVVLEQGFSQRVAGLSIDDLYLTHAERKRLAQQIHPLLATRGVPGTHDVALGRKLLQGLSKLKECQSLEIPLFDKAIDDRLRQEEWRQVSGPLDLILFEGWCVGALPQPEEMLIEPLNSLEHEEDSELIWRHYVNRQLQEGYLQLFAELDFLIMLKVPDMESVMNWRSLQEHKLAAVSGRKNDHQIMGTAALQRFIMHYERLTRAMLDEMPSRADLVLELNIEHQIDGVIINTKTVN
jgi:D-glycerate 3-kinase